MTSKSTYSNVPHWRFSYQRKSQVAVRAILAQIRRINSAYSSPISNERLVRFGIRRGTPLNFDNPDDFSAPVFFLPAFRPEKIDIALRGPKAPYSKKSRLVPEPRRWRPCDGEGDHGNEFAECAARRLDYLQDLVKRVEGELGPIGAPLWEIRLDGQMATPFPKSYRPPSGQWINVGQWSMCRAGIAAESPHKTVFVLDSRPSYGVKDECLRESELGPAMFAINYFQQYDTGFADNFCPVMVFSIYHCDWARLTQFHWDENTGNFVMRQSRLIDLSAETADECRDLVPLLGWMHCRPIGNTIIEP